MTKASGITGAVVVVVSVHIAHVIITVDLVIVVGDVVLISPINTKCMAYI